MRWPSDFVLLGVSIVMAFFAAWMVGGPTTDLTMLAR